MKEQTIFRLGFGSALDPGGWRTRGDLLDFEIAQSRRQLGKITSRGHTRSFAQLGMRRFMTDAAGNLTREFLIDSTRFRQLPRLKRIHGRA